MPELFLPGYIHSADAELGAEEGFGPGIVTGLVDDPLGQGLGEDVGERAEDGELLFDEREPGRYYLIVVVLVKAQEDLHRETVSAAVTQGVAQDPDIYIFLTEDLVHRLSPLVQSAADLAILRARLDVRV